jgi:hypothetical protein
MRISQKGIDLFPSCLSIFPFFIILYFFSILPSEGLPFLDCKLGCGSNDCMKLQTYLKKCQKCKKLSTSCQKSFCQNQPGLCEKGVPVKNIQANSGDVQNDLCMAKLFNDFEFEGMNNNDHRLMNLNMLDIHFFAQTGGEAYKRNLGTIRNLVANYLVFITPKLFSNPKQLSKLVDDWIVSKTKRTLQTLRIVDMHTLVDILREALYKKKGIPTKKKSVIFKKIDLPITVSNMGCPGEK